MKKIYFKYCIGFLLVIIFINSSQAQTNHPPTFTSAAVIAVNDNENYSYVITTNDADNDPITLTAPILPGWLSLSNNDVTTIAGSGVAGFNNGTNTSAQFNLPSGICIDAQGNIYVADTDNNRIRKITLRGEVTTLAGSGVAGFGDGTGIDAVFNSPRGIDIDVSGNLFVADAGNHKIRKITSSGVVTTLAGSGVAGFADGAGAASQFWFPRGIAVDNSGIVYVADEFNNRIRKITSAGVVTTLAGSVRGFADGTGTEAKFDSPRGVDLDTSNNIFVADADNNRIRKVTSTGIVTTIAGSGIAGFANGEASVAQFNTPSDVAVDILGDIYVADFNNHKIREVKQGIVTTLSGSGIAGFAEGSSNTAQYNLPLGIYVDDSENVYVSDQGNHKIRKIREIGTTLTGNSSGQGGTHNVTLNADDGNGGSTNQSFTITVSDASPTLTTLSPANNSTNVSIASDLAITFNENIQKGTGNILIKDASDDSVIESIDVTSGLVIISGAVATINPSNDLEKGKSYYIQIPNTIFQDITSNAYVGLSDTTSWRFTTEVVLSIDKNIIKGFSMYPNPASDVLNISANELIRNIQIFNLLGQRVVQTNINSNQGAININYLSTGTYFVIISTNKTMKSVKLIKY